MSNKLKSIVVGCAIALGSSSAMAESVNIGAPAWTGAQAIANLIKEVVVTRIGGTAELVPGNNAAIFQAMDAGKGDIDVHPDVWLPNQQTFTDKYVKGAGTVTLSSNSYEGKQSFCVSKAFSEENGVSSIFDLARPEIAKLMDSDGAFDPEKYIALQPSDDPDWFKKSKVMTEDALKNVQVAYSNSLKDRSPAIAEFLANMALDGETVSSFAFEIEGGKEPAQVAKEWVEANSERVDSWLGL